MFELELFVRQGNLLKGIDNCLGACGLEFFGFQDLPTSDFDPLGISNINLINC